ncbi:uncharacterized protein LOC116851036 isoform X2 [Odontomachus brunneus]|nr:uncharacterized protein LOC116851036 isoform X2 [Odontomachus brunneus]
MLMNTNFYSQYRLAEDALRGHHVGLWPLLSPYLFIQIVWGLRCEELLPRFVLHLPLELSVEILSTVIPCLAELEFERVVNLVIQLTNYMYKFIYKLSVTGTQADPYEELVHQLLANFQELLDQLTNPRITRFTDLPEHLRYERQGIILKSIIRMSKLCTIEKTHGGIQDSTEHFYTLTFGNEACQKLSSELLKSCINEMDQSLITLLMDHLKQVNCNMYLSWVEIDDRENPLMNLQRAIIMECVYFMKVIKMDVKLQENQELKTCLDQLVGSHNQPQLTLQEIYNGIESGQLKDMKDLLLRYREWNEVTLHFIYTWDKLLLNENFEVLFKYLKYTFSMKQYTWQEKVKFQILVMKIALKRRVKDLYDITLIYVLHHYNDTFLQELYNRDNFYARMRQVTDTWESPIFLKALLIYILHSPKEVLMTLISMAISKSNNFTCTAQQLLILRPFLCLKLDNGKSFLTEMLYQLCLQPHHWDIQKYTFFITTMLKSFVTLPEDFMINVFIRYLVEQSFDQNNVTCILLSICKILDTYTLKTGVVELCLVVGRKISHWRKCEPTKLRKDVNELLVKLVFVLKKCTQKHSMTVQQKRQVLDTIISHIEPLDKATFSPLLYMVQSNILTIIDDYAKRCYSVRNKYKQTRKINDVYFFCRYIDNIQLEKQDFVRHMILHATESEYLEYCMDMTVNYWFFFGWLNETEAYDNVTRITMEAICIGLEHSDNLPYDSFLVLLKYCMHFTELFMWKNEGLTWCDTIMQILLKNMSIVVTSIQCRKQLKEYEQLLTEMKNIIKTTKLFPAIWVEVDRFITYINNENEQSYNLNDEINESNNLENANIDAMFNSYKLICTCFSICGTEKHHQFIEKLEDMMFSDEFSYLNYHPL